MSHSWHSASDALVRGRSAREASERGAGRASRKPLGSPFGGQSRCNHNAIMIRLMNHHWQPLSLLDTLVAGGQAASRHSPSVGNHDVIVMQS